MKFSTVDKRTRHGVFLENFIVLSIFNIILFSFLVTVKYTDEEKNKLKWKGGLLGLLFLPSIPTVIGTILLLRYVIKTYNALKSKEAQSI